MEQSRSFVIVLSVTFVLASLFGVAAWLFYPRNVSEKPADIASFFKPSTNAAITGTDPEGANTLDGVLTQSGVRSGVQVSSGVVSDPNARLDLESQNPGADPVASILKDAEQFDDPLGRLTNPEMPRITSTSSLQLSIETRQAAVVVDSNSVSTAQPESVPGPSSSTGTQSTSSTRPQARSAQETASASASTAPVSSPASTARSSTQGSPSAPREEFWIQVISSPSRDRVENLQDKLYTDFSLGGRISSVVVNSSTYYRLRYGPYTNRGEAQKFLEWLVAIPEFSQSFISLEYQE